MVENGIKQMFSEAKQLNKKLISISLFGGEPSMNWKAVETAIRTAKMLEQETGIRCYKAIVTNGVMDTAKVIYLAENMDFIYFSFDGPRDLFLKQRKPKGGNDAYETIFNNAQEVYKKEHIYHLK
ncbi:MAG: radical SAM protein [Mediterraneibacter faecis]